MHFKKHVNKNTRSLQRSLSWGSRDSSGGAEHPWLSQTLHRGQQSHPKPASSSHMEAKHRDSWHCSPGCCQPGQTLPGTPQLPFSSSIFCSPNALSLHLPAALGGSTRAQPGAPPYRESSTNISLLLRNTWKAPVSFSGSTSSPRKGNGSFSSDAFLLLAQTSRTSKTNH